MKNFFAEIPEDLKDELFETVLQTDSFRIERIVSHGNGSSEGFWYDENDHEWVIVLKGSAGLHFENNDETIVMKPGDYIHIEKNRRHRVAWTDQEQETIWLAVHYS